MTCKIIDGTAIAAELRAKLKINVEKFKQNTDVVPKLIAVLVGDDPASEVYVSKKMAAAKEVGIESRVAKATYDNLDQVLVNLNTNQYVHGYILQLPLPDRDGEKVDPTKYFDRIDPIKDVDVFCPVNVGLLVQHRPRFKPCTPHAIQVMLHHSGIRVAEKRVVIINRSNVVGKPLSSMLVQECEDYANATVTVCHDRTPAAVLKEITLQSDIVVVAVGKPGFLTADMVKPGAVVVDVGISRIGKKVVGDVDPAVREVAGWLSPVPGGVGPMTVAMLLENTFAAAKLAVWGRSSPV